MIYNFNLPRNCGKTYYEMNKGWKDLKARKKWKEANQDKVKEYERKRYEKRKHLKEENEQLHSIIKEVREYIENAFATGEEIFKVEILEILDKEVN